MDQTTTTVIKPNKWLPFVALCLGFFMVIIDVTIVNVALPNIAKNLHVEISGLQWIVAGYALTFSCLLLSAGNLGDRLGAKTAFLWGLMIFIVTSLICGMAARLWILIAARFLQGVGAALLVPTSIALINALFENKKERARAIGIWAGIGGVAGAAGPILGAVLTAFFNWRAVFFINVPIGIMAVWLTAKYVSNPIRLIKEGLDVPGQIMGIISIAALAFSLIEAGRLGWHAAIVISAFGIFIVSFVIFLMIEKHTRSPMFPLSFFSSKTFSAAIAIGLLMNISGYGELFVFSLYFQQVRGYSVLMTGLALLPFMGLGAVGAYYGGRLTSHVGPRLPIMIGLIVAALGFLALLIVGEHTPAYVILLLPLAMVGLGITFMMPAATIAIIRSVPENRAGIASSAFNASRQLGSLLGVAIFGTIISTAASFIAGMHITLLIAGAGLLVSCIAAFACIDEEWVEK